MRKRKGLRQWSQELSFAETLPGSWPWGKVLGLRVVQAARGCPVCQEHCPQCTLLVLTGCQAPSMDSRVLAKALGCFSFRWMDC